MCVIQICFHRKTVNSEDFICFPSQRGRSIIELDDGKVLTGKPQKFDGKKPMEFSGSDFPNKTNPVTIIPLLMVISPLNGGDIPTVFW